MRESYNLNENNLDVTFIAEREIENYARNHPGQHITSDIKLLRGMGFDKKMINKVYILLRPPNLQTAIDYMTEINGIIQHRFFENKTGASKKLCYICKKQRRQHLGYIAGTYPEDKDVITNDELKDIDISEKTTCKVCYETLGKKEKKFNELPCGHLCCTECWVNYLQTLISEGKVEKIKCAEHKCEQILTEDFIMKHIKNNKKLVEKYQKFKNRAIILQDPNKKMCPEPNCESYLEKKLRTKYVKCKKGHYYCFECLKPPHGKETCETILEKDFLLWKKDKVIKKCPKCKIYTEKNEGCNHMTCTSCKFQWCWLCEGEYLYGHFDSGRCKGQQFTKANSIEEIENKNKNNINYTSNYTNYNRNNINNYNNNLYNRNNYNNNNLYNRNNYNNNRYNNNIISNTNNNSNNRYNNRLINNNNNSNNNILRRKKNKYFKNDEEQFNCCFGLSSIFPYCLHKVNYLEEDIDGYERLNALFIWFFGYFLFVAYQVYNTSKDDFCEYNSFRKAYIFFGMLISFCLFICYEIYFTILITPFIFISMVYPFFVYRIKMFFSIGDAHYYRRKNLLNDSNNERLISNTNSNTFNRNNNNNNILKLNRNNNNNFALNIKKKKYFESDEDDQNCCFSLSSIFPYCLHKVNYLEEDIDGYERLNALMIWFFGYFLFVAYQVFITSKDDFCEYNSFRKAYIFFGMLISFCLFICYEIYFTVLITPFILVCMVYPFFVYKIKMFFTIGNAHYQSKLLSNLINNNRTNIANKNNTIKNTTNLLTNNKNKKQNYFYTDEEEQNCCFSLSSIFPSCIHKVNYIKEDIDGYERLNALMIWFFGYFLFVVYQVYNTSTDDFCYFKNFRKYYLFFGGLISFCLFICYEIYFTILITPFILISMIYPFFVYKIKMFFTIGNAYYYYYNNVEKKTELKPV